MSQRRLSRGVCVACLVATAAFASRSFVHLDQTKLRQTLDSYIGTPYRYGGSSTSGIDCSGLAVAVYREQGVHLPRRTSEQFRVGEQVPRERLQVGDLVFFNTKGRGASHVGVMVDGESFVHASTSQGVREDELSNQYWSPRFVGARRVASTSTYVVSGDRVGASASDNVVLPNAYPFVDYELIAIPTHQVSTPRTVSIQFRTNVAGDVVLHPQVSLWQRLQIAGYQRIGNMLGAGSPDLDWPDFQAKVRFNDQHGHIPGFGLGYDMRDIRLERDTNYRDSVEVVAQKRGLFLVGSGKMLYGQGFVFGEMQTHAGVAMRRFRDFLWKDDLTVFAGIEQQLFRRLTLMGEIDNIFGPGGWHVNLGARLTITDGAVVEYDVMFLNIEEFNIDKVMKFSFNVPF